MSTSAVTYISKGFCPSCRYDLTGLPLGHKITCPECGTATNCIDLPALPPPGWMAKLGYAFVNAAKLGSKLAAIALAPGLVIAMSWPASSGRTCGGPLSTPASLRQLYVANYIYAADTPDGRYPKHIAALIPGDYFNLDVFEDVDSPSPGGSLSVGSYNLNNYDWSDVETAKLTAAINSIDTSCGYYRAGDFGFAHLGQPTGDIAIVFAWSMPDEDGTRWVIFDDGHVTEIDRERWRAVWKNDRVARYKLGLPVIRPPLP